MILRLKACSISGITMVLVAVFLIAPRFAIGKDTLPQGFVYVKELIPTIEVELRYITNNNFIGRPIDGYMKPALILSREAAFALKKVQEDLAPFGLGLKVFDAYRPQSAVDHFVRWAKDLNDKSMKSKYYPNVRKSELFSKGYIASRSGHSRGSAVDLTIISLTPGHKGRELDMGTPFDFFGTGSWPHNLSMTPEQRAHRLLLRNAMIRRGFKPYNKEWWHFSLEKEPFPERYFDFPVK
jgi:D-alanyl-D-alanine dipeptidase